MIIEKIKKKVSYFSFKIKSSFRRCFVNKCNLLIVDNSLPVINFLGFRVEEINFFLKNTEDCKLLTMSKLFFPKKNKMMFFPSMGHIVSQKSFFKQREKFCDYFDIDKEKVCFYLGKRHTSNGAYCLFLFNAFLSLNFFEKNNIPFVFTLLPGGYFMLNNHFSDFMLKKIFSSPMFKGVFVPQRIIYDYLLSKGFDKDKIYYSYGGGFCSGGDVTINKKYYLKDKKLLIFVLSVSDIVCQGKDKGFDIVLDVAEKLVAECPFVHFHFVGNNTLTDFPVGKYTKIRKNLHFYGVQKASFFDTFYNCMDLALSPNRPYMLGRGLFDGFPLQAESMKHEVALFVSDSLKMNDVFEDKKDIVIINHDINDIVQKIKYYIKNPRELYEISENGRKTFLYYFGRKHQEDERIYFIEKYLDVKINKREKK